MDVFLLRHGKAARTSATMPSDHMRPLTDTGRREAERIGRALRRMKVRPDVLASSPLLRAAETASIVGGHLRAEVVEWDALKPESSPADTMDAIGRMGADSIMLVGHEPHLSNLVSHMVSATMLSMSLKKGGLACVRIPAVGLASLRYVLTPRQMVMMS